MSTTPREEKRPTTPKTVRRPPRESVLKHWIDQLIESVGHIPDSDTILQLEQIYTDEHDLDLSEEEINTLINEGGDIPPLRY